MIKNDRQYHVTKTQLRGFEDSLRELVSAKVPPGIDPALVEVQRRALKSQLDDLQAEVEEYDSLRSGQVSNFVVENLGELPHALIKARIVRGLTQKDLAARLGLKEQQVQRWEANDYASASIETFKNVIEALGVVTREEMFVPTPNLSANAFLKNLTDLGIPREFLLDRFLPASLAAKFRESKGLQAGLPEILTASAIVSRVFGPHVADLITLKQPVFPLEAVAAARFKLPARTDPKTINAYTLYAHYLAALVESCTLSAAVDTFPTDHHQIHRLLTKPGEPITFLKAVNFLWELGVPVLPLRDAGLFHGAVWKIRSRFVIVLKQKTSLASRWLYDLLHEWGHVASGHVTEDVALIEGDPISPEIRGEDEVAANEWAEDALFDGDSNEIEEACVQACAGRLQRLKAVLPAIARRFNVNLGALANHMAFRLRSEGQDWWGAAHNLRETDCDPFVSAREVLLRHVDLRRLNHIDRDLLTRALTEE
jgi:transcriptional regulator with XRE-family HTH domain